MPREGRTSLYNSTYGDTFTTLGGRLEMETKLVRIAELAKQNSEMKFTSLAHLLNEEFLKHCHHTLPADKALGVDQISKSDYNENLDENISNLVKSMKSRSYKPKPVLRKYIDKVGTNKKRPLYIVIENWTKY